MTVEPIETLERMQLAATLAHAIWHEHYTPIIGRPQVVYMLETFQTAEAMMRQLAEGYRYYLLLERGEAFGYMAVQPRGEALFLSKLYVKASHRSQGHAKAALGFLAALATETGANKIELTVNKNNTLALNAYAKLGFLLSGEVVQAIGGGFVMDDYRMEKRVEKV
jgi:ribosomal protein S18 acetylase RimI-like enzyme